jgi:hypothetical protein
LTLPLAGSLACLMNACAADDGVADQTHHSGIRKVKYVILVMQENHSFDNYFGALAYAPSSPYHRPPGEGNGGCPADDHRCVDGLSCELDDAGSFDRSNANLDEDGSLRFAFHNANQRILVDGRRKLDVDVVRSLGGVLGAHIDAEVHRRLRRRGGRAGTIRSC